MLQCTYFTQKPTRSLWSLRRTHLKRSIIFCFTTDFQLNIVGKPILKTVLSFRVKSPNPAQQDKSTTMIVGLYFNWFILLWIMPFATTVLLRNINYMNLHECKAWSQKSNKFQCVPQSLLVVKAFSVILSFINKAVSINGKAWSVKCFHQWIHG